MECFFCEEQIGENDIDFTLILHNKGSKKDGKKMPTCFDCANYLYHKKKEGTKGRILR